MVASAVVGLACALLLRGVLGATAGRPPGESVATGDPPGAARAPGTARPTPRDSQQGAVARARFAQAVTLAARGDDEVAHELFLELLESYPALADYHLAHLAEIDERRGHPATAAAFADRLVVEHPESVWIPRILALRARLALARGEATAGELARRALDAAGGDDASRGVALLVQADLRAPGAPRSAFLLYQEVRRLGGPPAALARERALALERSHPELLRDRALLVAEADVLTLEGRFELAAERLRTAADAAPSAERGPLLRDLARALKRAERFEQALAVLRAAVRAAPGPDEPARLDLAYLLWSRDRDREARTLFEAILRDRPDHPSAETLRYALGRIAEDGDDLTEARARYRALVADGRDGALVREARWRLAWAPYRAGRLSEAEDAFAAVARESPEDRPAALYWQARIRARRGDAGAAAALFETAAASAPDGYYAALAEAHLGRRPPPLPRPAPVVATPPPDLTRQVYHWSRFQELLAAGLGRDAAPELQALLRGLTAPATLDPFLLEAHAAANAPATALRLARQLRQRGALPAEAATAYEYPRAYWPLVTRVAAAERLDPHLLLAVMRQESVFERNAVSPAGARGLLQLMPRTAARLAGRAVDPSELADPETNLRLGARYLRQLLDRYEQSLPKSLAAYNGGEDAVAKWEARAPDVEPDELVESISFRETRRYVKAVLANLRQYQRLYGPA